MEWRLVEDYPDRFEISSSGLLRSKKTGRLLSQCQNKKGYLNHATKIGGRDGRHVCFKIHRLVAKAFVPNPENKPEVNHKDGNKLNNSVENLEWVTGSENVQHAFAMGLRVAPCGYESPFAKLSRADVLEIRRLGATETIRSLGKRFGIHHSQISRILNGTIYKD